MAPEETAYYLKTKKLHTVMSLSGQVALWVMGCQVLKRRRNLWNKGGDISGLAVLILIVDSL